MKFVCAIRQEHDASDVFARLARAVRNDSPMLVHSGNAHALWMWDFTSQAHPTAAGLLAWDGSFCAGDLAFTSITNLDGGSHQVAAYVSDVRQNLISDKAPAGVFCAVEVLESTGRTTITSDPLSQYPIFYSRTDQVTLISNSQHSIERMLGEIHTPVTKSIEACAHVLLCGSGAWDLTGVVEVRKLPPSGFFDIHQGRCTIRYPRSLIFAPNATDYRHVLEAAAAKYGSSVSAICRTYAAERLVFDLSGGRDSRLNVIAALKHAGSAFNVHIGGEGDDRRIGEAVCRSLSLKRVCRPSNRHTHITAIEEIRRIASRLRGTCVTHFADAGRSRSRRSAHVRGACAGSILRTAYAIRLARHALISGSRGMRGPISISTLLALTESSAPDLARALQARNLPFRHLFRTQFVEENARRMASQLEDLLIAGVGVECLLDAHYTYDRGWRQNGMATVYGNRVRGTFEPQNDVLLARAAMAAPLQHRLTGTFTSDLMEVFSDERVKNIPYANHPYLPARPIESTSSSTGHADMEARESIQQHALELAGSIAGSDEAWAFWNRRRLLEWLQAKNNIASTESFNFMRCLLAGLVWRSVDMPPASIDVDVEEVLD